MESPGLKVVTRADADVFDEVIMARLPELLAQCKVAREKKGLVIDDLVAIIVARTEAGKMAIDEDRTGVISRTEAADFFDHAKGYAGFGAFLRDRSRPGFLAVVAEIDGSVTGRFVRPLSLESRGDA